MSLQEFEYYSDKDTFVYNCDCLVGLDMMINNKQFVELTVTSPPYFNVKEYSEYKNYPEYLEFLKQVFKKIFILTRDGRMCVVNISNILIVRNSRSSESKRIPLSCHFVLLMEEIGWEFLEDIIWLKPEGSSKNRNGGFYQHRQPVSYKPNIINEYIFVFKKPSDFLIDKIVRSYNSIDAFNSKVKEEYERSNVWKINPKTRSEHPAPYPVELTDKIISYYSFVEDVVLDPFFGSGTTSLSCIKYNRKSIGFEIHQKYIEIFKKDVKNIKSLKIVQDFSLDKKDYEALSKDESVKKIMLNPKKMLLDIIKKTNPCIKNDNSKIVLAQKIYESFNF